MSILCITPNPALDRTMTVAGLRVGEVHRVERVVERAGGKGLNVARVINQLGGTAHCVAPIGGATGHRVSLLASGEGIDSDWVWHDHGDTRTCSIVVDPDGQSTVLNEAGPDIGAMWPRVIDAATAQCDALMPDLVTISGSLPVGVGEEGLTALIAALRSATSVDIWIDTSGDALAAAAQLDCSIKVNLDEARTLLGAPITSSIAAADIACEFQSGYAARNVVVTDGEHGAAWASDGNLLCVLAVPIETRNPTGSGDAFLAGMVHGLANGSNARAALNAGVAAGAANASHIDPGVDPALVEKLMRMNAGTAKGI